MQSTAKYKVVSSMRREIIVLLEKSTSWFVVTSVTFLFGVLGGSGKSQPGKSQVRFLQQKIIRISSF